MPPLDLAPLRQAVGSLDQALGLAADRDWFDQQPRALRETLLAGIIRNFEFVYELSFRMIKRRLEADVESAELINAPRSAMFCASPPSTGWLRM